MSVARARIEGDVAASLRLSVLLIEDVEILRRGLLEMLRSIELVGRVEVVSSIVEADAISQVRRLDVILVPSTMVLETQEARRLTQKSRLLVLVRSAEPGHVAMALRLPAKGFVMEASLTTRSLAHGLETIMSGRTYMPIELVTDILEFAHVHEEHQRTFLTPREQDVLTCLARGLTNKEIARTLAMSEHGVKRYVASLLAKLHSTNRTMAVVRAIEQGILQSSHGQFRTGADFPGDRHSV